MTDLQNLNREVQDIKEDVKTLSTNFDKHRRDSDKLLLSIQVDIASVRGFIEGFTKVSHKNGRTWVSIFEPKKMAYFFSFASVFILVLLFSLDFFGVNINISKQGINTSNVRRGE